MLVAQTIFDSIPKEPTVNELYKINGEVQTDIGDANKKGNIMNNGKGKEMKEGSCNYKKRLMFKPIYKEHKFVAQKQKARSVW